MADTEPDRPDLDDGCGCIEAAVAMSSQRSEPEIELNAGGRVWNGTPEEFRALRDALQAIEFVDAE